MKQRRRLELLTAPLLAALGGMLFADHKFIAVTIVVFAYLWSVGFFTDILDEAPKERKYEVEKMRIRKEA
jgi:hypothetical protein